MAATLWVTVLLMLLATTASEPASPVDWPTQLESTITRTGLITQTTRTKVFEKGPLKVTGIKVGPNKSDPTSPPQPLFVVAPTKKGTYPILFFVHGTLLQNEDYAHLFEHVASHGYVVVAPQLYSFPYLPCQLEEIDMAASVLNWLPSNIQNVLVKYDVVGDLSKLAVSGHSRGAKTAFALALRKSATKLDVEISALIGVDPVAGGGKDTRTLPHILKYIPNSFNLSIPTMILGTLRGNVTTLVKPCAPNEVNYEEFFNECPKAALFVVTKSGHLGMLNNNWFDHLSPIGFAMSSFMCASDEVSRDSVRKTMGGVIVAFFENYFLGDPSDYENIISHRVLAPTELHPIKTKGPDVDEAGYYSQM